MIIYIYVHILFLSHVCWLYPILNHDVHPHQSPLNQTPYIMFCFVHINHHYDVLCFPI